MPQPPKKGSQGVGKPPKPPPEVSCHPPHHPPGPVTQQGDGGGVGVRQPPGTEPTLSAGQVGQELPGVGAGGHPVKLAQLLGGAQGHTGGLVTPSPAVVTPQPPPLPALGCKCQRGGVPPKPPIARG